VDSIPFLHAFTSYLPFPMSKMSRLKTKLARLEAATSAEVSHRDADEMLVAILARRDAAFWPWRHAGPFSGAVAERRRDLVAGRVGIAARSGGAIGWKTAHELRNHLIGRGLCEGVGSGSEVTGLKLTAQGEADARSLVGSRLWTVNDGPVIAVYSRLCELLPSCPAWMGKRWCSESKLFNADLHGDPEQWQGLTEIMLPMLTRGRVLAQADTVGRIYYTLVIEGPLPSVPTSSRQSQDWADELYLREWTSERAALEGLASGAEIVVPLPASSWRQEVSANV
jgi:hypothetical protein